MGSVNLMVFNQFYVGPDAPTQTPTVLISVKYLNMELSVPNPAAPVPQGFFHAQMAPPVRQSKERKEVFLMRGDSWEAILVKALQNNLDCSEIEEWHKFDLQREAVRRRIFVHNCHANTVGFNASYFQAIQALQKWSKDYMHLPGACPILSDSVEAWTDQVLVNAMSEQSWLGKAADPAFAFPHSFPEHWSFVKFKDHIHRARMDLDFEDWLRGIRTLRQVVWEGKAFSPWDFPGMTYEYQCMIGSGPGPAFGKEEWFDLCCQLWSEDKEMTGTWWYMQGYRGKDFDSTLGYPGEGPGDDEKKGDRPILRCMGCCKEKRSASLRGEALKAFFPAPNVAAMVAIDGAEEVLSLCKGCEKQILDTNVFVSVAFICRACNHFRVCCLPQQEGRPCFTFLSLHDQCFMKKLAEEPDWLQQNPPFMCLCAYMPQVRHKCSNPECPRMTQHPRHFHVWEFNKVAYCEEHQPAEAAPIQCIEMQGE